MKKQLLIGLSSIILILSWVPSASASQTGNEVGAMSPLQPEYFPGHLSLASFGWAESWSCCHDYDADNNSHTGCRDSSGRCHVFFNCCPKH